MQSTSYRNSVTHTILITCPSKLPQSKRESIIQNQKKCLFCFKALTYRPTNHNQSGWEVVPSLTHVITSFPHLAICQVPTQIIHRLSGMLSPCYHALVIQHSTVAFCAKFTCDINKRNFTITVYSCRKSYFPKYRWFHHVFQILVSK